MFKLDNINCVYLIIYLDLGDLISSIIGVDYIFRIVKLDNIIVHLIIYFIYLELVTSYPTIIVYFALLLFKLDNINFIIYFIFIYSWCPSYPG